MRKILFVLFVAFFIQGSLVSAGNVLLVGSGSSDLFGNQLNTFYWPFNATQNKNATFTGRILSVNNQVIYPSNMYIVSNDSRTGDFTDIQSAIDAAPTGGTIHIRPGTYFITGGLTMKRSGVVLEGDGLGTVIQFNGSQTPVLFNFTQQFFNIVFRDFKVMSTQKGTGTVFNASGFSKTIVENVQLSNISIGFLFNEVENCACYNIMQNIDIDLSGPGGYGFYFAGSANENTVLRTRIRPTDDNNVTGIFVNSHSNDLISVNVEGNASVGIDIAASGHETEINGGYLESNWINLRIRNSAEMVNVFGATIETGLIKDIDINGSSSTTMVGVWLNQNPLGWRFQGGGGFGINSNHFNDTINGFEFNGSRASFIGTNQVWNLNSTGSQIPDPNDDAFNTTGVVVQSANEEEVLRFRRSGAGTGGSGGILWGNGDTNDFFLGRKSGAGLTLEFRNYGSTPTGRNTSMYFETNGFISVNGSTPKNTLNVFGTLNATQNITGEDWLTSKIPCWTIQGNGSDLDPCSDSGTSDAQTLDTLDSSYFWPQNNTLDKNGNFTENITVKGNFTGGGVNSSIRNFRDYQSFSNSLSFFTGVGPFGRWAFRNTTGGFIIEFNESWITIYKDIFPNSPGINIGQTGSRIASIYATDINLSGNITSDWVTSKIPCWLIQGNGSDSDPCSDADNQNAQTLDGFDSTYFWPINNTFVGTQIRIAGVNTILNLNSSGSSIVEQNTDAYNESGIIIQSADIAQSIRFRRGGAGTAGTGGIRFGSYDIDDFYFRRLPPSVGSGGLQLDYLNYSSADGITRNVTIMYFEPGEGGQGKIGINNTNPLKTVDINGNLNASWNISTGDWFNGKIPCFFIVGVDDGTPCTDNSAGSSITPWLLSLGKYFVNATTTPANLNVTINGSIELGGNVIMNSTAGQYTEYSNGTHKTRMFMNGSGFNIEVTLS